MNKVFLFSVLCFFHVCGYGQELIIDSVKLKPGIYRTFEEFKYNNPSIEFHYSVKRKERGYGFLNSEGRLTFYRIDMERKQARSIGYVYGFCDGRNIYINQHLPDLQLNTDFVKLKNLGQFCYFEDIVYTYISTGAGGTSSASLSHNLLDMSTGEIINMNKRRLRKFLKNDPELLNAFNKEKKKKAKIKEYIFKYLEKYELS